MKIAFALDDSLDRHDGVQQYVLTLGNWMEENGHEVHYLAGQSSRTDLKHLHSLSNNTNVRFNGNRLSIPLPVKRDKLKRLLNEEKFDVLHLQMPYSPLFGARLLEVAPSSTKLVATFHILPLGHMQSVGTRLLSAYLRKSQKRLSHIWAVSPPAADFARSMGIETTVLPNVVKVSDFEDSKPFYEYKDYFTIVFLGRLVPRKGCRNLLEAIHGWHDAPKNLKVIICGDGPQSDDLKQFVASNRLRDTVDFVGFISEADKPRYLASADIAIFPSLGGESFGIVLLEAMASGSGVALGGNNPGYSSVLATLPQTLFDPKNATELTNRLRLFVEDTQLTRTLHKDQQELVKQFDVSVVGKKLLSYYQEGKN